jgi:hypothetical protein
MKPFLDKLGSIGAVVAAAACPRHLGLAGLVAASVPELLTRFRRLKASESAEQHARSR